ncbi:DUF364 domain-containing protein [Myxococcota bacterium]|nr:DUF364 domain-containing protein [Myxococcota bacterium]
MMQRLFEAARAHAEARRLEIVICGAQYTAVALDDGALGLALAFERGAAAGWAGRSALDALRGLLSEDEAARALGLATANALAPREGEVEGDALEGLTLRATDRVALVGHIQSLAARLRPHVASLTIFQEGDPAFGGRAEAPGGVARSDVALLTGSTLVNGSLPELLAAAGGCREVALIGPTAPLWAAAARPPVTLLSSIRPREAAREALLARVARGEGMREFKPLIAKVWRRVEG